MSYAPILNNDIDIIMAKLKQVEAIASLISCADCAGDKEKSAFWAIKYLIKEAKQKLSANLSISVKAKKEA